MNQLIMHERQPQYLSSVLDSQMRRIRVQSKRSITAVHVGAFDGAWDLAFWTRNKPAMLYGFEPQTSAFEKHKHKTVNVSSIMCYRKAIHPTLKNVELYKTGKNDQGASLHRAFVGDKSRSETVEATSLSAFYKEQDLRVVDLLRINCEGGEYAIFEKDVSFLSRVNVLCVAIHGKNPCFLTPQVNVAKLRMSRTFTKCGFQQICGFVFEQDAGFPVSHVWQVWIQQPFLGGFDEH